MSSIEAREKIMNAAEELFAESGFDNTSVRQLALKAKVNVAMISYYFGSKEKLFETLIEDRTSFLRQKIQELNMEDISSWQKVNMMVELFVDRFFDKRQMHRIMHREMGMSHRSKLTEVISGTLSKNANELRQLLNDGIRKKEFRKIDVEMMMASFVGTLWQVIGSYNLTCRVLGVKPEKSGVPGEVVKERLKAHLKELFKSHLEKR
ncbi:MAG: TetR family transcriptional regulator [Bacteroidota bacterium]